MNIKRLVIENFKSIERIELIEPNPFTVFVGPNGSGKSNIFEALEFVNYITSYDKYAGLRLFGGRDSVTNRKSNNDSFRFVANFNGRSPEFANIEYKLSETGLSHNYLSLLNYRYKEYLFESGEWHDEYSQFYDSFSRIFINNSKILKVDFQDNEGLNSNASNLEEVLERILLDKDIINEFEEWLKLFIPSFLRVEVRPSSIGGTSTLLIYEEDIEKPFTKALISDGTYNILALLTAIYQSEVPQFLCIEEPENGLNPKVIKEFVNLCRYACEEFGHYIWLNTHSQTLVSQLTPDEIILVDKKEGATQIKQIKGMNLHGLPMDEAWLSNALGGGLPW